MYETMEVYPLSWMFYLSFIFFNAFVFLNMMIGIVISKMQEEHDEAKADEMNNKEQLTYDMLNKISDRLDDIEKKLN